MPLSKEEKLAVINCPYFGAFWGQKDQGLCPMAAVAQMRGAVFYDDGPKYGFFYTNASSEIVWQAVEDVSEWLNIPSRDLFEVMAREGADILLRIPKEDLNG